LAPNASRVWTGDLGHHPTPIHASQIVFPKFIRYATSPLLTPIMNKMVKTMMSHKTVLDMAILLLNPAHLGKRLLIPTLLIIIISMGKGSRGKKFSECREFLD
jgi:hypothetical protein